MKNSKWLAAAVILAAVFAAAPVFAHCEIPCGIYDDSLRMKLIYEDIATIRKSIHEINELEKSGRNANQLVRWIINKDNHADKLQNTVTRYFMTQRLKPVPATDPGYADYIARLTTL
ncbi:superoxide dismutase [Ni], partial [Victivallis vadensis]